MTPEDLPQPGDSLIFAVDTSTTGLDPGPFGANQVWDFSQLTTDDVFGLRFLDPTGIAGHEQFPAATVAFESDEVIVSGGLSGYVFNEYRDTGLFVLGGLVQSAEIQRPTPAFFDPAQRMVELPTTFATSYVDEARLTLLTGETDSVRYVFHRRMEVTVDGWGTLRLPIGELATLRQRIETQSLDSVFVKQTNGEWELLRSGAYNILEYQWVTKESKGLALLMQFNDAGLATSVTFLSEFPTLIAPPRAAFSFEDLGDGIFQFADQSSNEPTSWFWDFEDGTTSAVPDPEHAFETPGEYSVCLTARNDAGEDTFCEQVRVRLAPEAAFRVESLGDGRFRFVDESVNDPGSWSWDFGDGNGSEEQNPEHTFAGPGKYDVCLTVANELGEGSVCQTIEFGAPPVADFGVEYLGGSRFRFVDQSQNGPLVWSWDFGDGAISKDQNPEHDFKDAGVFEVCLWVSNDAGSDRICKSIIVGSEPEAAFRIEQEGIGRFRFIDESANGPASWSWDFGDGATSENRNPRHAYSAGGTYSVCLTVANDAGEDVICQDLVVVLPPAAGFTADDLGDRNYQFTDASTNEPTAWSWDFGDGTGSDEQSPEHRFAAVGDYRVCLIASNSVGTDTTCQTITVGAIPAATFSQESLGGGTFRFIDESTNSPTSWEWDFGDGATSTEQNPEHTYAEPGEYQVCLVVANEAGAGEACLLVRVRLAPAAAFSFELLEGASYRFVDRSSNRPTAWSWDFGDGTTSTERDPEHTYAEPGEYQVCLTATNEAGADQQCRTLMVGGGGAAPAAAFRFEDLGLGIFSFTDESGNDPLTWSWDFGDGGVSKQQSPEYVFFNPGDYRVCLTVTNEAGTDEFCETVRVVLPPRVFFFVESMEPGVFQFRDQSINEPVSWNWDFGDGNTSTEQSPQYTFDRAGAYTVCLEVENDAGTDQDCQFLEVVLAPSPAFGYEVEQATAVFTDRSTNDPTNWSWDFGDGNISKERHPVHTFAEAGTYRVCLTAGNGNGEAEACRNVRIALAPDVDFTFAIDQGGVSFADESTNTPDNWQWDFGDGNTSTEQNPTHTYAAPGDYTVCLTAGNNFGTGQSCKSFTIILPPAAAFEIEDLGGGSFRFRDKSRNGPVNWEWDFGDGTTSTKQSPLHNYTLSGDYEVCLSVSNELSTNQLCRSVSAKVPPQAIFTFELREDGAVLFSDLSTNDPTSWEWDFGDGAKSEEQNPEHVYTENGVYEVCLTVGNEAGANAICDQVDITLTSIAPLGQDRTLIAFPNPAATYLNFALENNREPLQVILSDALGRQQHQFRLIHQERVEVGNWANGVYYYRVFDARGRLLNSGQIIVSH